MRPLATVRAFMRWLRTTENTGLIVSTLALLVSAYSVFFSVFLYRRQFELNVRPFVGISSVEVVKLPNDPLKSGPVNLRATIRNAGTMPASDIDFAWKWWISERNQAKRNEANSGGQRQLSLFPNAQFVHVIPFEGRYDVYLSNGYEAHIQYDITYHNAAANLTWTSHHEVVYSQVSGVAVVKSTAN